MCPAPRKPANRGLERNLTTHPKGGFRWKNPMTGDYHYLGWISRAQANTDARTLNLQFAKKTSVFDKIAGKASTSIRRLIALHLESFSPSLAESTRSNRSWEYRKLERELGDWDAASTTTMELSQYLKGLDSDGSRARYRTRLVELFDTAVCEGFCKTNPATSLRRVHSEVKRSRLTIECVFQSIVADRFRRS